MKQLEVLIGKLIASRFWVHLFFCLLFVFMFAISVVLSGNKGIITAALGTCLYMLGCTYIGRWCGKFWLSKGLQSPFLQNILVSLVGLSLLGAVGAAYIYQGNIAAYFLQYLAVCLPVVVLFMFLGLSITFARDSFLQQLKKAKLLQEQKESELRLMVSQLSPHFLFNTLNNLYGLSLTQHQRVPNLLLKLSELLRYSVYETREPFIPLKNELLYLENYIEFEKIQTGDRLLTESHLETCYDRQVQIAPMLLIVFVENAFKHSKLTRSSNIYIAISLQIKDGWIHFTIQNSYDVSGQHQRGLVESSGVGLHHTLKRLNLIYGKDFFYQVYKDNGMYKVELSLKAHYI